MNGTRIFNAKYGFGTIESVTRSGRYAEVEWDERPGAPTGIMTFSIFVGSGESVAAVLDRERGEYDPT